jgi:predicted CoA-binding protein
MPLESDAEIRELLEQVRTIAVIGIKQSPSEDAHRVAAYMQARGYRILPVNPKLERVLGTPASASLAELGEPAELIDVFRAARHLPAHVDEILALERRPRAVWLQLGIRHPQAVRRLEAAGISVVQDRCLMVEHGRLLGARDGAPRGRAPGRA